VRPVQVVRRSQVDWFEPMHEKMTSAPTSRHQSIGLHRCAATSGALRHCDAFGTESLLADALPDKGCAAPPCYPILVGFMDNRDYA
jgi:hypothetical protein